ncbi:tripartite-type tricarboxylate transporter receptor subunit TctC [Paracidovorax wautersii]|uniref:Tripartite-type tricarboxylate transporter receptor subunit TctC n=1 Tax=Paracidovorax wautersii TaxID=1177982 RepID=A0ABU1IAZ5_9BURK|nr:tripartite-type tricarboxylate transporter receptor subunit TctC [Paracidovorax wautersii]
MTGTRRIRWLTHAGMVCLMGLFAQPHTGLAQQFPAKPVRIITPFPVGGGPDGVARLMADRLSRMWGQPVTVENRPGGNGFIAIDAFKRGAKDGTDLMVVDNVHLAAYPSLFKKLPYDPAKDFEALLPLFKTYFFFTVATHSPYQSVGALIADAKAHPGKLNYGSWSVGNPVHLGSELFESTTGTRMEHVVFKETTQLYTAVSTGDLAFALGSAATAGPLQRAGRLRFLAIAAPQRSADYPDVPTVGESGGPAGLPGHGLECPGRACGSAGRHGRQDQAGRGGGAPDARSARQVRQLCLRALSGHHPRPVRSVHPGREPALR